MVFDLDTIYPALVAMLESTPYADRAHDKNLDVIKSMRDDESGLLGNMFIFVFGLGVSLLATGGTFLFIRLTKQYETVSASHLNNELTNLFKTLSDQGLDFWNKLLLVSLGFLILATILSVITNRLRAARLEKAYKKAVELYFELNDLIP